MQQEAGRRHRSPLAATLSYVALVAAAYLLGVASVELSSRVADVASWWPAAGAAVLAVLIAPRRHFVWAAAGVWLATSLSNYAAGRPPSLSIAYGLGNAMEAFLVAWLLTRHRPWPALESLRDVRRFLAAVAAGAASVGVVIALSVALLDHGDGVAAAFSVFASHGSALLAILPVAFAGTRPREVGARWQQILQPVVLCVVVLFVFWPDHPWPLAFLPMPFLVWGSFQFATRYVAVELLAVAAIVTTLTTIGGGPFATDAVVEGFQRINFVQTFLVTYAASILIFSAARNERLRLAEQLADRDQLLRGGILDAQIGLVIMHETAGKTVEIVQSNDSAARLLAPALPLVSPDPDNDGGPTIDLDAPGEPSPLVMAIRSTREAANGEWSGEFTLGSGSGSGSGSGDGAGDGAGDTRRVELFITRVPRHFGEALLTAQVLDVTARHRADVAIRQALADERLAAEHLRDVSKQKDDFVAAVSHELRTPITSIIGFVEVLQDEGDLGPEEQSYVDIVDRNARRLSVLVEDLLAMGAGGARPADPTSSADLLRLCTDTVEELTPFAAERGVTIALRVRQDVHAQAEHNDVARILTNLVTNAVKFTPTGGTVTIGLDLLDGKCVLTVADTGIGIPPDELERVFDRFFRSTRVEVHSVPGVGLGLALVRELVERNQGSIELESDGVSGTRAVVLLPVAEPPVVEGIRHRAS